MGFGGTFIIMKILDVLMGVRVSREAEEIGLDIAEHAERAYSDEEEFHSDFDQEREEKTKID
jgi:Amt family ammonium transporter